MVFELMEVDVLPGAKLLVCRNEEEAMELLTLLEDCFPKMSEPYFTCCNGYYNAVVLDCARRI